MFITITCLKRSQTTTNNPFHKHYKPFLTTKSTQKPTTVGPSPGVSLLSDSTVFSSAFVVRVADG